MGTTLHDGVRRVCALSPVAAGAFAEHEDLIDGARTAFARLVEERQALGAQVKVHLGRELLCRQVLWEDSPHLTPGQLRLLEALAAGNARIGQELQHVLRD